MWGEDIVPINKIKKRGLNLYELIKIFLVELSIIKKLDIDEKTAE